MPKNSPKLTEDNLAALLVRGASIYFQNARLSVEGKAEDRRFVMEGPSGKHTLLVDATDLARLNAHWINFANHALNAFQAPEPVARIKLTKGWGFGGQTV